MRGIGDEVIVKKFSYNILDDVRREQISPLKSFDKVIYVKVKTSPNKVSFISFLIVQLIFIGLI